MGLLWLFFWAVLLTWGLGSMLIATELLAPRRRTFAAALARQLPTDPGQLGWSYEEISFHFRDGSLSPGWFIQGHRPQGPVAVVCHGWGESRYDALPRLKPWLAHTSGLVVYDQRGHGESSARLCRLGTYEIQDLQEVIEAIKRRQQVQSLILLGYSMGAGVVIRYAVEHPQSDRLAVVVEGACPRLDVALRGLLLSLGWPTWPMAWMVPWLVSPWAWGAAWCDHRRGIGAVQYPLLVLHGQQDPIAPIDLAKDMAQRAARGLFVDFPDAGHLGLAEMHPKRYVDTIATWLNRNSGPTERSRCGSD